jgi:hypothetical protein
MQCQSKILFRQTKTISSSLYCNEEIIWTIINTLSKYVMTILNHLIFSRLIQYNKLPQKKMINWFKSYKIWNFSRVSTWYNLIILIKISCYKKKLIKVQIIQNSSTFVFWVFYTYSDSSYAADHEYHLFRVQNIFLCGEKCKILWRPQKPKKSTSIRKLIPLKLYHKIDDSNYFFLNQHWKLI